MSFSIFKIFQIFGIVSAWAAKALEDGKITLTEAVELAAALAGLLGIPTDIVLPPEEAVNQTTGEPKSEAAVIAAQEPHRKQVVA